MKQITIYTIIVTASLLSAQHVTAQQSNTELEQAITAIKQVEPKMEVTHEYKFEDEAFLASPAVCNGALFIRSDKHLFKIAKTDATQP